jgi:hypothetical protein
VYEDDFNTLKVVADRFALTRNALLIDPEYAKIAYLRDFDVWDLATTGSSIRKQIEVEWALEVSQPRRARDRAGSHDLVIAFGVSLPPN